MASGGSFGSRGFLTVASFYRGEKKAEFELWLAETQGIPQDARVGRPELLEHFKTFAEDFNTCTLPDEKYYDLKAWEARQGADAARTAAAAAGAVDVRGDEEARKREAVASKRRADSELLAAYREHMDPARVAELKRHQELTLQLQFAHKAGNAAEVARLQRMLNPEGK